MLRLKHILVILAVMPTALIALSPFRPPEHEDEIQQVLIEAQISIYARLLEEGNCNSDCIKNLFQMILAKQASIRPLRYLHKLSIARNLKGNMFLPYSVLASAIS